MKKKLLYLFLTLSFLQGCHSKAPQTIAEITLDFSAPIAQPRMSDFTDSLHVIQFETSDSCLLGEEFKVLKGDTYIITLSNKEIHQFSVSGKHIRKLSSQGRGPEEYGLISASYLDEPQERLFLTDYSKHLFTFDLKNNQCARVPVLYPITSILKIHNNNLLCELYTPVGTPCPYPLCNLNTQGEITKGLLDTIIAENYFNVNTSYLLPDQQVCLKTIKSDTVYKVNDFQKSPAYIIKSQYTKPYFQTNIWLYNESKNHYFYQAYPYQIRQLANGRTEFTIDEPELFRVNKQDLTPEIIKEIYIETLGISLPFEKIHFDSEKVYFVMSAFQFHELLTPIAEKQELSPAIAQLYATVKEDDNPLIFIGHKKQ